MFWNRFWDAYKCIYNYVTNLTYDILILSIGRPGQDDGQCEGRDDDSGGQEVAKLLESRRARTVIGVTARKQRGNRGKEVENQIEQWPPFAVGENKKEIKIF